MVQYIVATEGGTYNPATMGTETNRGSTIPPHDFEVVRTPQEAAKEITKRQANLDARAEAGKGKAAATLYQIPDGVKPENIKFSDLKTPNAQMMAETKSHLHKAATAHPPAPAAPPERVATQTPRGSFAKQQAGHARPGVLGAVAAAGTAVAVALATGREVHAAEVVDQVLPTNFSGNKTLCHQFGEVAGTFAQIAVPAVGAMTAGPVGLAGGLALSEVTGRITNKLTDMACGPK